MAWLDVVCGSVRIVSRAESGGLVEEDPDYELGLHLLALCVCVHQLYLVMHAFDSLHIRIFKTIRCHLKLCGGPLLQARSVLIWCN